MNCFVSIINESGAWRVRVNGRLIGDTFTSKAEGRSAALAWLTR